MDGWMPDALSRWQSHKIEINTGVGRHPVFGLGLAVWHMTSASEPMFLESTFERRFTDTQRRLTKM